MLALGILSILALSIMTPSSTHTYPQDSKTVHHSNMGLNGITATNFKSSHRAKTL